ncbi:MAG: ATP-binding protein [Desulfobacterales bacterium]|nr:ATP-binding protein [Desulfobacterales bacterium]
MLDKIKDSRFWIGIPPWVFIGAVAILLPIFIFITAENIKRQEQQGTRLLIEKGAALIRSFEAGTRTGMMEMHSRGFRLQRLLTETAQQPDIVYLLVTDTTGKILAHNDPLQISQLHGTGLDFKTIAESREVNWRLLTETNGDKIFEVFRKFSPAREPMGMGRGRMMLHRWFELQMEDRNDVLSSDLIIFVGLDMNSIEADRKSDAKHTVIMGLILLLVGFAGVILLFFAQSYRATKASLSRIKAFSDNLVEHMPIGLIAIDTGKNIVSFNQVAGSVLGLSVHEAMGRDIRSTIPDELCKQIDALELQPDILEREVECPGKDGVMIPLEVSATLLEDENHKFLGYVLIFKDLSEVKILKKEIARSQRLATVGKLAAGVAHEIRNPLSSIKGFATYFKERYHRIPEDLHIAKIMIQEVDRLNKVVGQLLEFAKPVVVAKKPVSMAALIEDSLKLIERRAAEAGVAVQTRLSSGIDPVVVDPDKIKQVLLNLYINAIEAMEKEGILEVELVLNSGTHHLEIRISDTGAGIAEKDLAHIFDPYFTTKASGTGLGLAIAHNIVEAHGGMIKVDSKSGQGATITVALPCSGQREEI